MHSFLFLQDSMKIAIPDVARKFYRELVRGRTSVRVVQASTAERSTHPAFILGMYRSGTTLLRYVLDAHPMLCSPPETHLLCSLQPLWHGRAGTGLSTLGYDESHRLAKARELADYFLSNYASSRNVQRWVEKSPGNLDCLPFIGALFPDAHYVVIVRHIWGQAYSYSRGGTFFRPGLQAVAQEGDNIWEAATRYWLEKAQALKDFIESSERKCVVVRYETLCEHPEATIKDILEFLDVPWEPIVLDYHTVQHDAGDEDGRISAVSGFQEPEYHKEGWPEQERSRAVVEAAEYLRYFGYDG